MPRYLCGICHFATPMMGYVANVLTLYLHCTQGVRGAPYRTECPVFAREPGADDEWPCVRLRGQMPTRYPMTEAMCLDELDRVSRRPDGCAFRREPPAE